MAETFVAKSEKILAEPSSIDLANTLLESPLAKTWEEGPWAHKTGTSVKIFGIQEASQTFIATTDSETNTSFMTHSGYDSYGNPYTLIRWADLPDKEGERVKSGGFMETVYDSDGKVSAIYGGKTPADEKGAYFNDKFWLSGEASTWSRVEKEGTKLSEAFTAEELASVETRFKRASSNIDSGLTEHAVEFAITNDRMSETSYNLYEAFRNNLPSDEKAKLISQAMEALIKYFELTGKDPEAELQRYKKLWAKVDNNKEENNPAQEQTTD
jgi:hypothetical protein